MPLLVVEDLDCHSIKRSSVSCLAIPIEVIRMLQSDCIVECMEGLLVQAGDIKTVQPENPSPRCLKCTGIPLPS